MGLGTYKTGIEAGTYGELVLNYSDDGPREEAMAGGHLETEARAITYTFCRIPVLLSLLFTRWFLLTTAGSDEP